jgi:uncharacterized damage-inducible protein DinB
MANELETFSNKWNEEAQKTVKVLRSLPADQYDFRPDQGGRSIGELAWHLAEVDAYVSHGIAQGKFDPASRPPGIERPRSIAELAPGYERVHADAVERLTRLTLSDLDRKVTFFTGEDVAIRDLLWSSILLHIGHHRGQLSLLCRLAGAVAPGLFGPNREEMASFQARRAGRA